MAGEIGDHEIIGGGVFIPFQWVPEGHPIFLLVRRYEFIVDLIDDRWVKKIIQDYVWKRFCSGVLTVPLVFVGFHVLQRQHGIVAADVAPNFKIIDQSHS